MSALPQFPPPSALHRGVCSVEGVADAKVLERIFNKVDALCVVKGLSEDDTLALRLCVDEVCTNVVSYAYEGQAPGPLRLEVWWPTDAEQATASVVIRVLDWGMPFDPSAAPAPSLEAELEDRAVGGLGWFLVHQMMDEARYERTADGCNLSTLTRQLRGANSAASAEESPA